MVETYSPSWMICFESRSIEHPCDAAGTLARGWIAKCQLATLALHLSFTTLELTNHHREISPSWRSRQVDNCHKDCALCGFPASALSIFKPYTCWLVAMSRQTYDWISEIEWNSCQELNWTKLASYSNHNASYLYTLVTQCFQAMHRKTWKTLAWRTLLQSK